MPYVLILVLLSSFQIIHGEPEGPPQTFNPRGRVPVHPKLNLADSIANKLKKESQDSGKLSSQPSIPLTKFSINLISTPTAQTPTVKIYEVGTGPSVTSPSRFPVPPSSAKSLLDDTEALGVDPTAPDNGDEPKSDTADDTEAEPKEAQESFLSITGTKATFLSNRSPFRPNKIRSTLASYRATPTVMIPIATRPPIQRPTDVPILEPSTSPSISSVLPPAPPSPATSFSRSMFGRNSNFGGASSGFKRSKSKASSNTRFAGGSPDKEVDQSVITDFVFSDIKCYRTKQKEYFGARIHLRSGFHVPYIRDRPDDPLTSSDCQLEATSDPNAYQFQIADLRSCGVEHCGDAMCVTLVFPRVPTLAMADDEVTTIRCSPQKNSMSEMKTISFAGDSLYVNESVNIPVQSKLLSDDINFREGRRSGSTVEGGGQDFAAEVGVFRQNSGGSNGLFVKRVSSGGVVQLGEPLQLRSVVRGGDGWTFSKLSDVKVWRMNDNYSPLITSSPNPGDATEVITLVDHKGCRNSEYKVIAEADPLRDPRNDLVHHFTFKAFLFRGQKTNEPLIVTAKVHACQERDDCDYVSCADSSGSSNKMKRSLADETHPLSGNDTKKATTNVTSMEWNSELEIRVVGLKNYQSIAETSLAEEAHVVDLGEPFYACAVQMSITASIGAFLTLVLCILILSLGSICRRSKEMQNEKLGYQRRRLERGVGNNFRRMQRTISTDYIVPRSNTGSQSPPNPMSACKTSQPVKGMTSRLQQLEKNSKVECSDPEFIRNSDEDSEDDGMYVVYYKRSKSAPASLREKQRREGQKNVMADLDSSDESQTPKRHTLRSLKQRSHRNQILRNRKSIDSLIYSDLANYDIDRKRHSIGSTRIQIGSDGDISSSTDLIRSTYSDSAYTSTSNSASTVSSSMSDSSVTSIPNTTRLVSTNGFNSSTNILIIPETHV